MKKINLQNKSHLVTLCYGRFYRPLTQSALRGSKTKFLDDFFFSWRHPQRRVLRGQEFLGIGLPIDFMRKGQKTPGLGMEKLK